MKKIFIVAALLSFIFACEDFSSINENPKASTSAPAETLYSNAQKNLVDLMSSTNVNTNVLRLMAQHWAQTTYNDESSYNLSNRNVPQAYWTVLYRDILRDLKEAKRLAQVVTPGVTPDPAAVLNNKLASAEILEVYSTYVLVTTFGDMPYSKALDITNTQPSYDTQQAVYNDLLTRLQASLDKITEDEETFPAASDLIYHADMAQWKTFGYSLLLKMAMTIADADNAKAKSLAEKAAPHVLTSSDGNAMLQYLPAPPNTNPLWVDLVQSNRRDFVGANTLVSRMNALSDPRLPLYFAKATAGANAGTYAGGIYGSKNSSSRFSNPSALLKDPTFPGVLLTYSEVEFFLAEAAARGYAVGGTAESHYNSGIMASIQEWGGSEADAAAYLAQEAVAYTTATGTFKEKIGVQKWFSLYNRGHEAWTEWRRFDFPIFNVPEGLTYADIPVRFTYPVNEQNLNTANYNAAVTSMGGNDFVSVKLFWDKF